MTTQRLGVIMNGVTGRMGLNQHLVRSIIAIRDQGGVLLANGDRVMPDPILVGRDAEKVERLAKQYKVARWTTELDKALGDKDDTIFFDAATTQARPSLLTKAIGAGKHVYCEKPIATNLDEAVAVLKLAAAKGVKHGTVQDKLFLPGLKKLAFLRDSGFFGRILAVRGEFGYWVFEGDWQEAQRPSWNYRAEDGGGIILDMVCHWRYVLDNLFGDVESVSCIGSTDIPQRWDEKGSQYKADGRRFRLCDVPAQGRRDRAHQYVLGDAGLSRRSRHLPGRRHTWLRGRRAQRLRDAGAAGDAAPGMEPRREANSRFLCRLAEGAGEQSLRQWFQGAVGDVHPSRLRGRAVQIHAAGGRQGRAAWRNARCKAGASGAGSMCRRSKCEDRNHEQAGFAKLLAVAETTKAPIGESRPIGWRAPGAFPPSWKARSTAWLFPRLMWSPIRSPTSIRGCRPLSTGTGPLRFASTSGISGSASPKRWTPRSAGWDWIGQPRWS